MSSNCAQCQFENPAEAKFCRQCGRPLAGSQVDSAGATVQRSSRNTAFQWSTVCRRVTISVVLISLSWRVLRYSLGFPVWGDEAYVAVDFAIRGFAEMIEPSTYGQIVPLGFMWAELAVTKVMGLSEWSLRLLPFLTGCAALIAFPFFARRTLPRGAALIATAIFAGSYYIARHCVEIKPYSFDLSVAVLLYMLGWSVLQHPRSAARWVALSVAGAVGVWLSLPAMFVGGAVGLALTWRLFREGIRSSFMVGWSVYGLALCGSAPACIILYTQPHAEAAQQLLVNEGWAETFPPLSRPWQLPVWFVRYHTGHMFAYPQGGSPPGSIVTFVLFCIGAARVWRTRRDLFILLIGPFVLTFVAAALHKYPYGQSARVSQYVAPAVCLLAGLGLAMVLKRFLDVRRYRPAVVIAACLMAIIPIGGMIRDVSKPYKNLSVKRCYDTFRMVADESKPTDLWVVYNANERVPYAPYLGDVPGRAGQFSFDALQFAPGNPRNLLWSPPPETVTRSPGQTVWLLAYRADIHDPRAQKMYPQEKVFPSDKWEAYIATLSTNLGEPEHDRYPVRQTLVYSESIEVCRFAP